MRGGIHSRSLSSLCPKSSHFSSLGSFSLLLGKKMDASLTHQPHSNFMSDFDLHRSPRPPHVSNWPPGRSLGELFRSEAKTCSLTHLLCVLDRMGVVSSKKQVKEKSKDQWSPMKASTHSREPPPLPPLVSDRFSQLEGDGEEGEHRARVAPLGAAPSLQQVPVPSLDNPGLPQIGLPQLQCHLSSYCCYRL